MQLLNKILSILADIFSVEHQRKEIAETYLANAVDHADLEARQKYLSRIGYL